MTIYQNTSPDSVLPNLAAGDIFNYGYTGSGQAIKLPAGKYLCECWGARAGGAGCATPSGKGGYSKGVLDISYLLPLYLHIGEFADGRFLLGTYNGGGAGGGDINIGKGGGFVGGGATDIRLLSGDWNNIESLKSRIMVAGGAGGTVWHGQWWSIENGVGGGLIGETGHVRTTNGYEAIPFPSIGGSQTSGGTAAYSITPPVSGSNGVFGIGGDGGVNGLECGGGGGGGYYGGGGGVHDTIGSACGGSGGSGFISGMTGCDAIDSSGNHTGQPIHYSGIFFTDCEMQSGITEGHGFIKITCLEIYPTETALLRVTMLDSSEREYMLPLNEINAFIAWFNSHVHVSPSPAPSYMLNKMTPNTTEYLVFNKIISFEIKKIDTP
ncbi:MAG: hypothetical protein LBR56_08180 [Sporomusaceae bacterium]|jgi:hypothetical protein|nr:hypothetical protein [Sporomusaceae bacterium]